MIIHILMLDARVGHFKSMGILLAYRTLSEARRMGLRFFLSRRYSCEASRHTSTRQSQQASSPSV